MLQSASSSGAKRLNFSARVIQTRPAALTVDGLQLSAASPGAWGNSLHVVVDHDGITADVAQQYGLAASALFNLAVYEKPAGGGANRLLERLINLSVTDNVRRADRI